MPSAARNEYVDESAATLHDDLNWGVVLQANGCPIAAVGRRSVHVSGNQGSGPERAQKVAVL